ncbi:MAG: cupin domain-containing protein [Candidatus Dadabacteria bacterium]|nr:MAG: cupin domain-containing protein [Candidatus Dadabacteria bacterium]
MKIGEKLRRLRLQAGLTQEDLANRADLTKGFISQLENDATSPSIATLQDLLNALGVTLGEFFREDGDREEPVVFRKEDRVPSGESEEGFLLSFLIPRAHRHLMEPVLVELEPGASTEPIDGHEGEEFGFVLAGQVDVHLGDRVHRARKGDCFYYTADRRHWLANTGKWPVQVLWVASPPSF